MKKSIKKWVAHVFFRLWSSTWRYRIVEPKQLSELTPPFLLAHWHGHELALLPLFRKYRCATLVSHSEDGEIMDYLVKKFGGFTTRGSSSRGAISGLLGLNRYLRKKVSVSLAVDGPKGPRHQMKLGILQLASTNSVPLYAGVAVASHALVFRKSWSRAILPLPFSRIQVEWLGPYTVQPKNEEALVETKNRIESDLLALENQIQNSLRSEKKR